MGYICTMEQLYHILDAFFAPGILAGMSVCLFFLYIPPKAALRNYRMARYVMGTAYLFYAICIYMEYHVFNAEDIDTLARPIILFVACFQAFLFTYTLITLIRLNYVTLHKVLLEVTPIVIMTGALFVAYMLYPGAVAQWVFWLSAVFYVGLLVRYVVLFTGEYRRYEMQMDNFFSDEDSRRLHWVKRSFFISLAVGVLALVYALLPIAPFGLVFMVIVIIFYTAFGVRFINYALQFQWIETAITNDNALTDDMPQQVEGYMELMLRVDALMQQDKLYRKSDLSINDIAERLGERARAISSTISTTRQMNFKTYVNEFRVLEAKRLLDEDKENGRTIDAIASESGFTGRTNFYRVFKRSQGISPTDYRLRH